MLDLKKMLTKISKQMKEELVYKDYSCPAVSITAGGIGTYATSVNVDITKSGYEAVSLSCWLVGHPGNYNVSTIHYNGKVYFNFYRTGTGAYSVPADDVKVRVLYKKSGGGTA